MGVFHHLLYLFTAVSMVSMITVSLVTLVLKMHRDTVPENMDGPESIETAVPRFHHDKLPGMIVIPVRGESFVLRETVAAALAQPLVVDGWVDVGIVVSHRRGDDPRTLELAKELKRMAPHRIHLIPASPVLNKPAALNGALERFIVPDGYKWVMIVDGETKLAPGIVEAEFAKIVEGYDIVTGPVLLTNASTNPDLLPLPKLPLVGWWGKHFKSVPGLVHRIDPYWARTLRWWRAFLTGWWRFNNCMEYFPHFRSRMKAFVVAGVVPLPGNTLTYTIEALETIGFVPNCLTEDAAGGIKACREGLKIYAILDLKLASLEVTPESLRSLLKQRTRWMQGFQQVFNMGDWKHLPKFRQRLVALFILLFPIYQAVSGLVAVPLLLLYFTKVPVILAVFALIPLVTIIIDILDDLLLAAEFSRVTQQKIRLRDYTGLVLGKFPYQAVLSIAATKAIWRHLRGKTDWHKTERGEQSSVAAIATALTEEPINEHVA